MAASDWSEIYDSYSAEELADEITDLKEQIKAASNISSQTTGPKSYGRDLREMRVRLQAAVRVQNQRKAAASGYRGNGRVALADFSGC